MKDYYATVFRPDLTTIVVIGNVTPSRPRPWSKNISASGKPSGPPPQTDLPPVPANAPAVTAVPDKSRVQVNVGLG